MTNKQQPLGFGFAAASTAAEVVDGIDLTGRNVVVTAGHVGLGLETTRALAHAGANVVVASRNPATAAAALADLDRVEVDRLDLVDPTSVEAFAQRYRDSGRPLHILINNAAIMGGELVRDARGYEAQFATNHLGHFQLTNELLPVLRAAGGARVVEVSSWGHHLSDIRWDDPHFESEYDPMVAYGQSKTANVLFAVELDRLWSGDGIRGYSLHPGGIVTTNLAPWLTLEDWRTMGLVGEDGQPVIDPDNDMKTPEQGASTTVFAATSPLLAEIGGVYLQNNDIAPLEVGATPVTVDMGSGPLRTTVGVTPYAVDPDAAQRLWTLSEKLLTA
ncbi:SDR family NAD(P)-dependent oxidoreductase [Mycolicibacterium pyrenivorans]|uniref:SDR family NAD(P)-dependent oxidoreductase n=1 Tax=Mycolicibacterium pyrenivorans TaxID=187102 RepID=UPI0021F2574F|nr:SDR family NAD(P)-dependent oxidoreductase [Mycolicibacterium pyrenivorans]MCV7151521.1 SDR family NAD(P)-dependent oxidoreductase [Mycolicibacterium pyrenivorans]